MVGDRSPFGVNSDTLIAALWPLPTLRHLQYCYTQNIDIRWREHEGMRRYWRLLEELQVREAPLYCVEIIACQLESKWLHWEVVCWRSREEASWSQCSVRCWGCYLGHWILRHDSTEHTEPGDSWGDIPPEQSSFCSLKYHVENYKVLNSLN